MLYFWHSVGNSILTTVSNMFTNLNLTDMETCYKAVRGEVARRLVLTADRFGFEPEITARLAQANARIYEVPISYAGRTYAEGKKIGWRDGVAAFWHIVRFNMLKPVTRDTTPVNAVGSWCSRVLPPRPRRRLASVLTDGSPRDPDARAAGG